MSAFSERLQGRLDRLGTGADEVGRAAGLPPGLMERLLEGTAPPPKGRRLLRLAEAVSASAAYLVGLDPDAPLPEEFLAEDQGSLGLLAGDEEAMLRAYRRLDVASRASLLHVAMRMAPEPEVLERKPRQAGGRS